MCSAAAYGFRLYKQEQACAYARPYSTTTHHPHHMATQPRRCFSLSLAAPHPAPSQRPAATTNLASPASPLVTHPDHTHPDHTHPDHTHPDHTHTTLPPQLPPTLTSSLNIELLVEMQRIANPAAFGGDPMLFLKPFNTPDRNVPTVDMLLSDVYQYADYASFTMKQSFHYVVKR